MLDNGTTLSSVLLVPKQRPPEARAASEAAARGQASSLIEEMYRKLTRQQYPPPQPSALGGGGEAAGAEVPAGIGARRPAGSCYPAVVAERLAERPWSPRRRIVAKPVSPGGRSRWGGTAVSSSARGSSSENRGLTFGAWIPSGTPLHLRLCI